MKLSLVTLLRRYVGRPKSQDEFRDWWDDNLVRLQKRLEGVHEGVPERFDIGFVLKRVSKED